MSGWLYILLVVIAIYAILSIVLFYLQDYFLFRPEKLPADFQFHYKNQRVDEYNITTRDGAVLNGLHFKVNKAKGVVLYLKGNSKSIKGWGKFAVDFTRHGFDVVMLDYRGFGKSTGRRTQKALKRDMQVVYNRLKEHVAERHIIVYGRSLGSGLATKIASVNNPLMLILDAPYYSLTNVTKRYVPFMPLSWLIKYPLPTYKWIKYVQCPIHIIHGTEDKLIPYRTSVKLSKINANRTRLHPIIGGRHKNLTTFDSYHQILRDILSTVSKESNVSNSSFAVIYNNKYPND